MMQLVKKIDYLNSTFEFFRIYLAKHLIAIITICSNLFLWQNVCLSQSQTPSERLISQLGCSACHATLEIEPSFVNKIPNHSYAGLRYNPAYLFDFLQQPAKVRRHINASTMPNFHLSEKEALALALFLETQNQLDPNWPDYPSELETATNQVPLQIPAVEDSVCLTCHSLNGRGGVFAVDFATVGYRLQKDWVKKYLVSPTLFDVPVTTMPEVFYQQSSSRKRFVEKLPEAAEKINQLANHLFSMGAIRKIQLEQSFISAKNRYPEIAVALGEKVYRSQNCSACHGNLTIKPLSDQFAPNLKLEGIRVNTTWLSGFLNNPFSVRPFGFIPGFGSRMPDFGLSEGMVNNIVIFLSGQNSKSADSWSVVFPQELTGFSINKTETLLADKLSCLGCHQLGNQGGRIGPNLSSVHERLNPTYIYNQIREPRSTSPNSIMPKIPLPDKNIRLIYNYIFQQTESKNDSSYLSLVENDLYDPGIAAGVEKVYLKNCAICHGRDGNGNGFNAKYLPTQPTKHGDGIYMSKRPDDTLYDGIHAGGFILNKSRFMPPWGFSLSEENIGNLVNYIRKLCDCKGPDWSLDDALVK
jgi:cytochrome c oxidase cbb3-type subunit III